MQQRVLFIVNPISGALENRDELVSMICHELGADHVNVWHTTGERDAEHIQKLLESESPDLILVGGGDGTIKLVSSQLRGRKVPILPVPFGSANGLCVCLGIRTWEDSLKALNKGQVVELDVLDLNGELCLHLADFGFNASLVKRFEEDEERGMAGYFKSSVAQAFENNRFKFGLTVDGEKQQFAAKMLVIANGTSYGTGAKINPMGKFDDGKFEVIILNPDSFQEWAQLTMAFFREDFGGLPFVHTIQSDRVLIENFDRAAFHIDGETQAALARVEVRLAEHTYSFYSNLPVL